MKKKIVEKVAESVFSILAPPSVNKSYRNATEGELARGSRGRKSTESLRNWKDAAGWQVHASRAKAVETPCRITIEVGACNEARDVDNFAKAVCDLVVARKLIPNDSLRHVHAVTVVKAFEDVKPDHVRVTIQSISRPTA